MLIEAVEDPPGALQAHLDPWLNAHPGAFHAHPGAMWRLILNLHAHPKAHSCLTWVHGGSPWGHRGSPWTRRGLSWSRRASPWRLILGPWMLILGPWRSSWGHGAHPRAVQARPGPFLLTLALWRLTLDPWRFIFWPWRLTLEPWKTHPGALEAYFDAHPKEPSCLTWVHGGSPWGHGGSPWTHGGLSWSYGASPCSLGGSPWGLGGSFLVHGNTRNFAKLKYHFRIKFRLSRNSKSHFCKHPREGASQGFRSFDIDGYSRQKLHCRLIFVGLKFVTDNVALSVWEV